MRDERGFLILHCLQPGCTRPFFPWCPAHDRGEWRRNAREVFGWSLRKEDYGGEAKVPHA